MTCFVASRITWYCAYGPEEMSGSSWVRTKSSEVGLELVRGREDLVRVDVAGADVEDVVDVALLVVDRAGEDRGEGVLAGADRAGRQLVALVEELVDDDRDRARVEAARERRAHRHLRLQAQPHRLDEAPLVLGGRGVVVGALDGRELEELLLQAREHAAPDAVRVDREHLAGGEPLDPVEEGLGAVLVRPEAQVAVDGALVDLLLVQPAGEDRLDLAREEEHLALAVGVRHPGEVDRLDAEVVAGQGEPLLVAVPDRQPEHAVEAVERVVPPLRERLEHDLGVGVGREGAAERLQLGAQVEVVVDLAVVGDHVAPVGGVHRLLAVGDVDDGQPPVREPAGAVGHDAVAVGPAVLLAGVHALEERRVGGESVVAGDAAHAWVGPNVLGGGAHGIRSGCRRPSLPRMPCQSDSAGRRPVRPGPSQLSRMEREPSAEHRNSCGAQVKVPGSGGKVEAERRAVGGWGQAGRCASSQADDVAGHLVAVGLVEDLVTGARVERAGDVDDADRGVLLAHRPGALCRCAPERVACRPRRRRIGRSRRTRADLASVVDWATRRGQVDEEARRGTCGRTARSATYLSTSASSRESQSKSVRLGLNAALYWPNEQPCEERADVPPSAQPCLGPGHERARPSRASPGRRPCREHDPAGEVAAVLDDVGSGR